MTEQSLLYPLRMEKGKVRWALVRDILTCSILYGLHLPEQLERHHVVEGVFKYSGWQWGKLYEYGTDVSRLAIGRFLTELGDSLDAAVQPVSQPLYVHYCTYLTRITCVFDQQVYTIAGISGP